MLLLISFIFFVMSQKDKKKFLIIFMEQYSEKRWLFHNKQSSDLDNGVLGKDSWFLSPRRPAKSLQCDSDAYHSFSYDLILLHSEHNSSLKKHF